MRDWQLDPTLITFMGNIPGMLAVNLSRCYRLVALFRWVCGAHEGITDRTCHKPSASGAAGRG